MPKTKIDSAQALRDVKASWESRGFRADYLSHYQFEQDGDPYGELAYQRAFAEAAKKEPPRLPNPSHYPNSPSAQTFLQKRNDTFFNGRATTETLNPKYESPIPDYWRSRDEARAGTPVQQQQQQQQQQQPQQLPPPPPTPQQSYMPPPPPPISNGYTHVNGHHTGLTYATPPANSRTLPPPTMEPRMDGPAGPINRLR